MPMKQYPAEEVAQNSRQESSNRATSEGAVQYPWLDWVRFAAALQVLLVHARFFTFVEYGQLDAGSKSKLTALWFALTRTGLESVLVFFVLSGFLVGGKVIERVANGTFDSRSYTIDRFSRIYTPLVPALLFALFIDLFFKSPPNVAEYIGNLFSFQGVFVDPVHTIGSIWSLSYEIWFYILAGALAVVLLRRSRSSTGALLLLLCAFIIFGRLQASLLFCWVLGALVYLCPRKNFSKPETVSGFVLLGLGSLMIQLSTSSNSLSVFSRYPIIAPAGQIILSSGIALILRNLCTITTTSGNKSSFARLGSALAAFSYTLYLIHYPVMIALQRMGYARQPAISGGNLWLFVMRIVVCLLVSYGFYWMFERNTPIIRRLLRTRLTSPTKRVVPVR